MLGELLDHKEADLYGKGVAPSEDDLAKLERLRAAVRRERRSPHRLRDLAIGGDDLIELGYAPGPGVIGQVLARLLDDVIRSPELNTRRELLRARAGAAAVIHWEQPGYVVAFTTRVGGVSDGAYASLNLTLATGDDPRRVEENRRLACAELGLAVDRLSYNRQVHSTTVHAAGARGRDGDGLWTSEPGLPMLAFAADCVPIAIAAVERAARPCRAARGLARAVGRDRRGGRLRARRAVSCAPIVGPAIGPCCYEVGPRGVVALRRRPDVRPASSTCGRRPSARFAARASAEVERVDLCTRCHPELFFSYRRDGDVFGVQGVIGAVA